MVLFAGVLINVERLIWQLHGAFHAERRFEHRRSAVDVDQALLGHALHEFGVSSCDVAVHEQVDEQTRKEALCNDLHLLERHQVHGGQNVLHTGLLEKQKVLERRQQHRDRLLVVALPEALVGQLELFEALLGEVELDDLVHDLRQDDRQLLVVAVHFDQQTVVRDRD